MPEGVEVHLLPFPDVSAVDGEAPHEATFQKMMTEKPDDEDIAVAAGRFMTEEYLRFPTLGGAQRAVRQVISLLADGRPVIAHCFAGKDRTGFTVATVLEAVGVDRDAILADFLRSNDGGAAAAGADPGVGPRPIRDRRGGHLRRSAADRGGARRAGGVPGRRAPVDRGELRLAARLPRPRPG